MTAAFVLHHRPYRDSSLLIELLTQHDGIVPVVARGAKRPKSSLKAALQQFSVLAVNYSDKGELRTLKQAELEKNYYFNGETLLYGLYINELLIKLIPRLSPCDGLFEAYHSLIQLMNESSADKHRLMSALRTFEKELLSLLGYGISFTETLSGEPILSASRYVLHHAQGFEISDDQDSFVGQDLLNIDQNHLQSAETLQAAKFIMRQLIQSHLGNQQIKTRLLWPKG